MKHPEVRQRFNFNWRQIEFAVLVSNLYFVHWKLKKCINRVVNMFRAECFSSFVLRYHWRLSMSSPCEFINYFQTGAKSELFNFFDPKNVLFTTLHSSQNAFGVHTSVIVTKFVCDLFYSECNWRVRLSIHHRLIRIDDFRSTQSIFSMRPNFRA